MTAAHLDVGGVALLVDDRGSGDPILVLHGFAADGSSMDPLTDLLSGRRIVPDLVGHGASDAPDDPGAYTMDAMVEQLRGMVVSLALTPLDVVGYSMGARTALSLTQAVPDLVRTLTLIGGTAGLTDPDAAAARIVADEALADRIERDGIEAFVEHWEALPLFATQRRLPAEGRERIRSARLAQRPEGLARHLRGAGTGAMRSMWHVLGAVECPTLLVVGGLDAKFLEIAERMAKAMPDASLLVVPDVGHAAHIEAPVTVARAVEAHRRRG